MIPAVDEALRRVVREGAALDEAVALTFEAPTRDWAARRTAPTVSVYLYDLQEVVARRESGRAAVRGPDGTTTARRQPQRWYRLSYLLTCWTARPEDEHALLATCLVGLLRHPVLPSDWLGAGVAALPCTLAVALPPPSDRKSPDLWSALGGELKPSLDVQVTVPLDVGPDRPVGPPVTVGPELVTTSLVPGTAGEERRRRRAPVDPVR